MPSASDEDRERMRRWFGSIDDHGPIRLLESHGYVLRPDWYWTPPTPGHTESEIERYCICFLIEEWDFGDVTG
jgi:hypothetical protein